MIRIIKAEEEQFTTIRSIALQTWPHTFGDILSREQIDYMLEWMYSIPAIESQVYEKGHTFILAKEDDTFLGYASYQLNYSGEEKTKIHKIYVLPSAQGKGIGKKLIDHISGAALSHGNRILSLNVNRNNKAVDFYKKTGFKIAGSEDISIGRGFLMEDYIMEKKL